MFPLTDKNHANAEIASVKVKVKTLTLQRKATFQNYMPIMERNYKHIGTKDYRKLQTGNKEIKRAKGSYTRR